MASANHYYGNYYQLQQAQQSGSGGAFNQISGGWNLAAHTAFPFPPATSTSMPISAISTNCVGSTCPGDDDWETVQTDFFHGNNHSSSVSSANSYSNSGLDDEEWTLDDANNQGSWTSSDHFSPTCSQYFGFEEENIDEGFKSQENASSSQLTYAGQEECYDDGCYMGNGYLNDHYATAEDFEEDEDISEPEMTTPFVKKPVKRDWCGNPVFHDDWNLGVKSPTGSSTYSSCSGGDEEVRTILKRRCNRSMI